MAETEAAPGSTPKAGGIRKFAGISHPKKRKFLQAFSLTCSIQKSADFAGIDRHTHYDWMRQEDPIYRNTFERVRDEAGDMLEDELIERAVHGWSEPVIIDGQYSKDSAGNLVTIRRRSDTCLIFALKGAKGQKYRARVEQEITGKDGSPLLPIESLAAVFDQALKEADERDAD